MEAKRFDNYQKQMSNAMKQSNVQSDNLFTQLSIILDNLKQFVNSETFSQTAFKQEVIRQFLIVDTSDDTAMHFQNQLKTFCSSKNEAIKTISDLYNMVKPLSQQLSSWYSIAKIADECMEEIQKSICNSN